MVRGATFGSRPGGAAPQGEVVRCGSQKTDAGFLCHENTTSLLSVFGPGSRQHVRLQQSNGAESRGRKSFSAEALPYRQTAGGSCRSKEGGVQLLARTDRDMPSSNRGRQTTDKRWSALHWGAVEGMNGVVMVGGFCVVVRITAPAADLFHLGERLRSLAGNCTEGPAARVCTKKALESSDPRARIVCYSAAGRRLRSRTARIPDSG